MDRNSVITFLNYIEFSVQFWLVRYLHKGRSVPKHVGVIFDLVIDLPVRQTALEKLGQLHRQLLIPVLLTAIADPDQEIRAVALEILEGIDEIKGDSKCQSLNAAG